MDSISNNKEESIELPLAATTTTEEDGIQRRRGTTHNKQVPKLDLNMYVQIAHHSFGERVSHPSALLPEANNNDVGEMRFGIEFTPGRDRRLNPVVDCK